LPSISFSVSMCFIIILITFVALALSFRRGQKGRLHPP